MNESAQPESNKVPKKWNPVIVILLASAVATPLMIWVAVEFVAEKPTVHQSWNNAHALKEQARLENIEWDLKFIDRKITFASEAVFPIGPEIALGTHKDDLIRALKKSPVFGRAIERRGVESNHIECGFSGGTLLFYLSSKTNSVSFMVLEFRGTKQSVFKKWSPLNNIIEDFMGKPSKYHPSDKEFGGGMSMWAGYSTQISSSAPMLNWRGPYFAQITLIRK